MIFLGTDIVEVGRIRALIEVWDERFLLRIFTPDEIRYCRRQVHPAMHFAGRFAAKEAVKKALYSAGVMEPIPFQRIEVRRPEPTGAPEVEIAGCGMSEIRVSISHTNRYAVATALVDQGP